jgi:tRNA(fMet)-specific endonuclease VapC
MKNIVLDTNCYAAYRSGDSRVLDALANAETVWMSVIVLGELYAGFRGGTKMLENQEQLDLFLAKPTVRILDAGKESAEIFGEVKDQLKNAGTPLPINDVWIGAHTMETGSVLVSYDRHFKAIAGLRYWPYMA